VFPQELIYILTSIRLTNFIHTSALTKDLEGVKPDFLCSWTGRWFSTMIFLQMLVLYSVEWCVWWNGKYMKMPVFSDVAPCSLVEIDSSFRGAYWFHHQVDVRGSKHLRNVGQVKPDNTAQHPRRQSSSYSSPWETEISPGKYRVVQKELYTFKNVFYKYYWTYGDLLYTDWTELSKLFPHLTSTRCEPHVWRGRYQIDNPALPTLVAACHR
jgi:hypothetical protein